MIKSYLGIALALVLGACNVVDNTSADKYRFEKPQFVHKDVEVSVVELQSLKEISVEAAKFGAKMEQGREIMAFSLVNPKTNRCKIYMVSPQNKYMPEYIGHELMHCVFGQFHPNQP